MRIICYVYLYKYAFETCESSITLYFLLNYFTIKCIEIYVAVNGNVFKIVHIDTCIYIYKYIFAFLYGSTL